MLSDVSGDGVFRGNSELLIEGFFGSVLKGQGDYLGGAGLQYRFNFVQPGSKCIPYAQIGAGALFNDIHKDQSQSNIGQAWEVNLGASMGIRYFLSDKWAISLEGGYSRITNFGQSDRDEGVDSLGAQIGLSRFF